MIRRMPTEISSSTTEIDGGADRVVALDLGEDGERGDLDAAGEQDQRAELTDRAGEREPGAGEDGRPEARQDDRAGRWSSCVAPSEAAASSMSLSSSISVGWTERTTNGSVMKSSASDHADQLV